MGPEYQSLLVLVVPGTDLYNAVKIPPFSECLAGDGSLTVQMWEEAAFERSWEGRLITQHLQSSSPL